MLLINRPEYLEKLKSWQGQIELIKIVTGVRRCGKSFLFTIFQNNLRSDGIGDDQILHINLELNENEELLNSKKLHSYVLANLSPNKINYVFLDEIQLVPDWQRTVNSLRLHPNIDVYLTGSNAHMFSSELTTLIGGRYVEIKMLPLSFHEYVIGTGSHADDLQAKYDRYINESGFPQTVAFSGNKQMINDYLLDTVYLNTMQKDVVQRFKIKEPARLDNVVRYMFDNIGNETSLRKIADRLKADGIGISPTTLDNYIQGLLDSYLIYKCDRWDIKGKTILQPNPKYYAVDMGLRTALLGRPDTDVGHMLENIVYLELLRRGYKVYVGKVKGRVINNTETSSIEVDFVAAKAGGEIEYYQVAWSVLNDNPKTLHRELASLEAIKDNFPKYLLTMDYGSGMTDGIKRLNVLQWLMGEL